MADHSILPEKSLPLITLNLDVQDLTGRWNHLTFLFDSGSDVVVLPRAIVEKGGFKLEPLNSKVKISHGFSGSNQTHDLFQIRLRFNTRDEGRVTVDCPAIVADADVAVIGIYALAAFNYRISNGIVHLIGLNLKSD